MVSRGNAIPPDTPPCVVEWRPATPVQSRTRPHDLVTAATSKDFGKIVPRPDLIETPPLRVAGSTRA